MDVNRPEVVAEAEVAFAGYEAALAADDVEALAGFFWASPLAVRYGDRESLYGHDAITAFRRARPPGSAARELLHTVVTTFGSDVFTTSCEFRRHRSRETGRQQQTWVRTADGWRIVAAHISIPAPEAAPATSAGTVGV